MRIVCATRYSAEAFPLCSALGRSLQLFRGYPFVELRLFPGNTLGLSAVYNRAIDEAAENPALLIFVHDDVHLTDFYWPIHLLESLQAFDVVGLVGNRRRVPRQPGWAFIDEKFTWDERQQLSGVIAHGTLPIELLNFYGAPAQEVKLLDGMFLAARSEVLKAAGVRFDERFEFHFYDMDFCREAERRSLRMGTAMISAVHESGGSFNTPSWQAAYARYLDKWQS
jgi:GT2 family glycosyltransferase